MIVHYRKSQVSTVIVAAAGAGAIVLGNLMWARGCSCGGCLALAALLAAAAVFGVLTVEVNEKEVTADFGMGFPWKRIPIAEIEYVRPMEMAWYFGWGARWIPRGWMFRGTGTAVVEIVLKTGRRFCVGSPEPGALAHAIDTARRRGDE